MWKYIYVPGNNGVLRTLKSKGGDTGPNSRSWILELELFLFKLSSPFDFFAFSRRGMPSHKVSWRNWKSLIETTMEQAISEVPDADAKAIWKTAPEMLIASVKAADVPDGGVKAVLEKATSKELCFEVSYGCACMRN